MNKMKHWTMLAFLGFFSPAVSALGLGGAVVESYLDQPLDVRVELISQSEEELQSITAGLASADDFQLLGLSRTAISVPLTFEVVTDATRPYVHITSELKINEPVLQVLVEVVWASGRMLREYTLFLDPPTIDSPAPPAVVKPAPVKTPPVETRSAPIVPIQKNIEPKAEESAPDVAAVGPGDTGVTPSAESAEAKSDPVQDSQQQQEQPLEQFSEEEVYGPVASGETLWGIAREYSRGSGYSINQAMLALQRKNPEAFIKANINSLKRGAILRLPAFNELGELTSREALLEVLRQEEEIRTGTRSVAPDFSTPTVADSGDYQASADSVVSEPALEVEEGRLELVPPAEEERQETPATEPLPEQAAAVETLQEELSRTEEELVNARQENTYLAERIKELEDAAKSREGQSLTVGDSDLANMESKLAQERAADQAEAPVAITPGGEKQAWYAGKTPFIIGLAIILIALITWGLRRRAAGLLETQRVSEAQAISDDARDVPSTLDRHQDEGETVVQPAPEPEVQLEPGFVSEIEPEPEPEPEMEAEAFPETPDMSADEEPTVLLPKAVEPEDEPVADVDEEEENTGDDDPEIKLDLARAYLSLGDKEAAKSMLDEVMKSGSGAQKAEARQMLEEL